jgi:hypothetical protein
MGSKARRPRRDAIYEPPAGSSVDEHALEVSGLVRELQAHLERLRHGHASAAEQLEVKKVIDAVRRVQACPRGLDRA